MTKRVYYRLEQAAELSKKSVDDLIHFGATDQLPIFMLLPGVSFPKLIFEHDTAAKAPEDFRIIDPSGSLKGMYSVPVSGPQRITAHSLRKFESNSDNVPAGLDWNSAMDIQNNGIRRWYYTETDLYLSVESMIVMEGDLALLTGKVEEKSLETRERNVLYIIIDALLKEAKIGIERPYKAAEAIEALLVNSEGNPKVGKETIAKHLKKISSLLA